MNGKWTITLLLICMCCIIYAPSVIHAQDYSVTRPETIRNWDTFAIIKQIEYARKFVVSNPDSSLILVAEPLQQSFQAGYNYGLGISLLLKGTAYTNKGLYNQAEKTYKSAINYLIQSGTGKKEVPRTLSNLGNVYFFKGQYDIALQCYYNSINLAEKVFPDEDADYIYSNLAGILTQIGRDPASTRYYLDKAEQSALKNQNYLTLCKVYNNRGFAYITSRSWDSSLLYFHKALRLSIQHNITETRHMAYTNIGIVYLEQKIPDSALHYLKQAYEMDTIVTAAVRERARGALGAAYLQLKQYDKAAPLLHEQYQLAIASYQKTNLREAYYNMSQLYGAQKNYEQAYKNAWNYILLNDTIAGQEIINNVNKLEVDHRTAEKEKKLITTQLIVAQQEKAIEQRNTWLTVIISSVIIAMLLLFTIIKAYASKQKLTAQKLSTLEKEREIDNLKATISGEEKERIRIARELHDGLGALIAAAKMNLVALGKENLSIANRDIYQSTSHILDEVGTELRVTAHNMMPRALMEKNLVEAVTAFCNYTRQSKNLDIEVQAYGNFEKLPEYYQLGVYRIIQELVHNIVKHAKASKSLVQLMWQDTVMSITIEDNGIGFDPEKLKQIDGVGLESIKTRVKTMNGTFTMNTSPGKGTSVYIEFEMSLPAR